MDDMQRCTILAVDDEEADLLELTRVLTSECSVITEISGKDAVMRAVADKPDLILLDVIIPGINGFDILKGLKEHPDTSHIPVIVLTSRLGDDDAEERGFYLGAVDYITKPFNASIVRARVRNHIKIIRQLRMSERLSYIDPLTDIANRRCFDHNMTREWWRSMRDESPLSLLMMDIDKFKEYNDAYGHPQGDRLLRQIVNVFTSAARRATDLIARLGGEEFGVLMPNTDSKSAREIAERIRGSVEKMRVKLIDEDTDTAVTISVGCVTVIPTSLHTIARFISIADERLYKAKNAGRNRVCTADDNNY